MAKNNWDEYLKKCQERYNKGLEMLKYKSVRISKESYEKILKIQHKQELDSVIATIDYLVRKEKI